MLVISLTINVCYTRASPITNTFQSTHVITHTFSDSLIEATEYKYKEKLEDTFFQRLLDHNVLFGTPVPLEDYVLWTPVGSLHINCHITSCTFNVMELDYTRLFV